VLCSCLCLCVAITFATVYPTATASLLCFQVYKQTNLNVLSSASDDSRCTFSIFVELTARNMTANSVTTLMNRSSSRPARTLPSWRARHCAGSLDCIIGGYLGLYPGTSVTGNFAGDIALTEDTASCRRWTGRLEGGRAMKSAEEPSMLAEMGA
jgi:hypothetical protein